MIELKLPHSVTVILLTDLLAKLLSYDSKEETEKAYE